MAGGLRDSCRDFGAGKRRALGGKQILHLAGGEAQGFGVVRLQNHGHRSISSFVHLREMYMAVLSLSFRRPIMGAGELVPVRSPSHVIRLALPRTRATQGIGGSVAIGLFA